jgi:hypothetical protein
VEFKALLADPSEAWQAGWGDEELNYKLERCIFVLFMSGFGVRELCILPLFPRERYSRKRFPAF